MDFSGAHDFEQRAIWDIHCQSFVSWHHKACKIYFFWFSNNIFITSGPWTCGAPVWSSTSPSPALSLSMRTRISTSRSKTPPSCKFLFFLCSRIQLKIWHKNKAEWIQNIWYHGSPGTHRTPGRRSPLRQLSWSQTFCRWTNRDIAASSEQSKL